MMTVKNANPGYVVVTDSDNGTVWEVRIARLNPNGSRFHPPASAVSTLLNRIGHGVWSTWKPS